MNLEYVNKEFVQTLYNFVNDIHIYTGNENAKLFLKIFQKLKMDKIIRRFCEVVGKYGDAITEHNETIFSAPFKVLPDIDISEIWPQLNTKQKGKLWIYLEVLYMTANMLNQETEIYTETSSSENVENKVKEFKPVIKNNDDNVIVELGFNPYTGITSDNDVSVTDLCSSIKIEEECKPMNISTLTKSLGLEKMLKLDSLVQKLKEIDPEEIDNATENLKNVMKTNEDDKTSNLIADIIGDVAKELKSDKLDSSDPLENIIRIAERVSKNMGSRMSDDGITAESMLSLAQNLSSKCNNGQQPNIDPMKIFGSILGNLNNLNNKPGSPNVESQCKDIFKNLNLD